jgi:hypothetical protein
MYALSPPIVLSAKSLNDCVSLIFISTVYDSQTSLHTLDPKRIKAKKGPRPDRKTSKCFVVKIQSGKEYRHYNPNIPTYGGSSGLPGNS